MHTVQVFIKPSNKILSAYFAEQTHLAKNLRNSANFIIRNLRTGLAKDPAKRTENENYVIELATTGIERYNEHCQKRAESTFKKACSLKISALSRHVLMRKVYELKKRSYRIPDKDHWMVSYEQLDAIM